MSRFEHRYLPFAVAGCEMRFHLVSLLYERASMIVTTSVRAPRFEVLVCDWLVAATLSLSPLHDPLGGRVRG